MMFTPTTTITSYSEARNLTNAAQGTSKTAEEILKEINKYIVTAANRGEQGISYPFLSWEMDDSVYNEVINTLQYFGYYVFEYSYNNQNVISIDWEEHPE